MTFKGHLHCNMSSVKAVFRQKFVSTTKSGPKWFFLRKKGVNVKFWFCDYKKVHPCMETCLLTYFASMSMVVLSVSDS